MQRPELKLEEETAGRDAALVVVPGYLSRERGADNRWIPALRACGWDGAIYSLGWDASSARSLIETLVLRGGLLGVRTHWWWIKRRAQRTAIEHSGPLLRNGLPHPRVSLVGHSLGAHLVYHALTEARPRPVIDDWILAGGALRRDSATAWRRACGSIGGRVLNLRNEADLVLGRLFRAAERLHSPCGLKPIKHPADNLVEIDVTEAMAAAGQTGLLDSHSGYPLVLPTVLRFVDGRAEPV